jgi:hypothetical protein
MKKKTRPSEVKITVHCADCGTPLRKTVAESRRWGGQCVRCYRRVDKRRLSAQINS